MDPGPRFKFGCQRGGGGNNCGVFGTWKMGSNAFISIAHPVFRQQLIDQLKRKQDLGEKSTRNSDKASDFGEGSMYVSCYFSRSFGRIKTGNEDELPALEPPLTPGLMKLIKT